MDIFESWLCKRPIAHRGFHNEELPENSLGAFSSAIENGFPIEMDVRIIDDETLIVFHDESLSRMTGKSGYVSNLKVADLSSCKLKGSEYSIPSFDEFLEFINGKTPILIEIKNEGKIGVLEGKLLSALKSYKGEYAIQSFNPYSVEYFKINAPQIVRGQLSCFFKDSDIARYKKFLLKRLMLNRTSSPNFIAYDFNNLPNRWVNKYSNLPVLAWTLKSAADVSKVTPSCTNIIFEGFDPRL